MGKGRRGVFTHDQVIEYRRQYQSMIATGARPGMLMRQIAGRHGVSVPAVQRMLVSKTYKAVKVHHFGDGGQKRA